VLFTVQDNHAMTLLIKVQLNFPFKDIRKNSIASNILAWTIIRKVLIKQSKITFSSTNMFIALKEVQIKESIPIEKNLVAVLRP
jgi:hypothetical protein